MTFGELFAGIGGFRLGLERAGHECEWACEIDPFCRKVYLKHWPETEPFYEDIRDITDPPYVDMLCGGFPCQDLSVAGKQAGITGERSGLWSEFARLIRAVRPRIAFVENVPGLLIHGMGRVLGDLAEIGYDAEWEVIPASAVGAPHRRDRVWIVAYAQCQQDDQEWGVSQRRRVNVGRDQQTTQQGNGQASHDCISRCCDDVSRDDSSGRKGQIISVRQPRQVEAETQPVRCGSDVADPTCIRQSGSGANRIEVTQTQPRSRVSGRDGTAPNAGEWSPEPDVGRVAHGVPDRVDRLKSLGNAVVPQVVEWIGRRMRDVETLSLKSED